MSYAVYIYGCTDCGMKAVYLRKFKQWAEKNNHEYMVIDTKADETSKGTHAKYILGLDGRHDSYTPLVVDENENVYRLEGERWN